MHYAYTNQYNGFSGYGPVYLIIKAASRSAHSLVSSQCKQGPPPKNEIKPTVQSITRLSRIEGKMFASKHTFSVRTGLVYTKFNYNGGDDEIECGFPVPNRNCFLPTESITCGNCFIMCCVVVDGDGDDFDSGKFWNTKGKTLCMSCIDLAAIGVYPYKYVSLAAASIVAIWVFGYHNDRQKYV